MSSLERRLTHLLALERDRARRRLQAASQTGDAMYAAVWVAGESPEQVCTTIAAWTGLDPAEIWAEAERLAVHPEEVAEFKRLVAESRSA